MGKYRNKKKEPKKYFLGGIFGSDPKTTTEKESEQKQRVVMPDWIEGPQKDLLSRAVALSNQGFTGYDDPRVAQLSADEAAAYDSIRDMMGQAAPRFEEAFQGLDQVQEYSRQGIPQEYLDQYMNPYIENVLDVGKRRAIENYDRELRDFKERAGQAAAFGGSRFGLQEEAMAENFRRQLQEQETLGLSDAYETGMNRAQQGLGRLMQSSLSKADLAGAQQRYGLTDAAALEGAGQVQRGIDQAGLDADYQEFIREQAYPYEQLQFLAGVSNPLANLYRGQDTNMTSTTTQTHDDGQSTLQKAIGMAAQVAGMAMGIPGIGGGQSMNSMGMSQLGQIISNPQANPTPLYQGVTSAGGGLGSYSFKDGGVVTRGAKKYQEGGMFESDVQQYIVDPLKYLGGSLMEGHRIANQRAIEGFDYLGDYLSNKPAFDPVSDDIANILYTDEDILNRVSQNVRQLDREQNPPKVIPKQQGTPTQNRQKMDNYTLTNMPGLEGETPSRQQQRITAPKQQQQKQSAGLAMPRPQTVRQEAEEDKDTINYPLLAFGAAMLGSEGDFFEAFGAGGEAYMKTKLGMKQKDKEEALAAREAQMENMRLALDQLRTDASIRQAESLIQKRQRGKITNPYDQEIKQLRIQQMRKELKDDPYKEQTLKIASDLLPQIPGNDPIKAIEKARNLISGVGDSGGNTQSQEELLGVPAGYRLR